MTVLRCSSDKNTTQTAVLINTVNIIYQQQTERGQTGCETSNTAASPTDRPSRRPTRHVGLPQRIGGTADGLVCRNRTKTINNMYVPLPNSAFGLRSTTHRLG